MVLKLYNSLSCQLEDFKPINPSKVGIYTCGPTVYSFVTIGNFRTYFLSDVVVRVLKYLGFNVDYIMNITDVGHLTGDNLGDADIGEDRLEKAAKKEQKTVWDIAKFYTNNFLKDYEQLNLTNPRLFTKATDHIAEQIELIKKIEAKGFTYIISDGVYFDVRAYEKAGNVYGQLSTLDEIKAGARVAKNPEKKDPRDFALWKFSPQDAVIKRQMEWESPWGVGFPGWHIECSAMSIKYLGEQFDIHVGGEDLKSTHHPNEISQSEAATGKIPFVKYWIHGAFLLVDGGRMGKSLGNAYTLNDIIAKGFDPLALRYFYFTGHYRKQLNFTWEALRDCQISLDKLREYFKVKPENIGKQNQPYEQKFLTALLDDFNLPKVLAVIWELVKDKNLSYEEKHGLISNWNKVLGLDLEKVDESRLKVNKEIGELVKDREQLRKEKKWEKADEIRKNIENKGYILEDKDAKTIIKLKKAYEDGK